MVSVALSLMGSTCSESDMTVSNIADVDIQLETLRYARPSDR